MIMIVHVIMIFAVIVVMMIVIRATAASVFYRNVICIFAYQLPTPPPQKKCLHPSKIGPRS